MDITSRKMQQLFKCQLILQKLAILHKQLAITITIEEKEIN